MSSTSKLDDEVLRQHSYGEALDASARIFSSCDTKWPDFLLPAAKRQIVDDLLRLSLHIRRVGESSGKIIQQKIVPMDLGVPREFLYYETDFWSAINRIVHHHRLEPLIITQDDFYQSDACPMAGHLIADLEVESDRGVSNINVAGFAVAATNQLGMLSKKPQKVFQ